VRNRVHVYTPVYTPVYTSVTRLWGHSIRHSAGIVYETLDDHVVLSNKVFTVADRAAGKL